MTHRALVTGGAGFIGSHVAEQLLEAGYEVTVLDDLSSGRREQVPVEATFRRLDIAGPEATAIVRDGNFDVICHLAAQIDVRKSVADPGFDAQVNIGGSLNLLEAIRVAGARTRFIFSSTGGAIYGDLTVPPSAEDAPKDPQSPYGTAKLSVEYYMGYYARVHGLDTVALRYANVYGPRQDPHGEAGVVAIFCGRVLDGRAVTIFGDGTQTRDYVYVGDVARANVIAAKASLPESRGLDSRAFNVGTGIETDVVTLARVLMGGAGREVDVQHAPARAGEQLRSAVQVEKAADTLGWRPEVTLEDGLARTHAWFRARRNGDPA